MTIVELSRSLADRKITSRQLVEQSLAAIRDPHGEGARTFLLVHENEALAAADRVDAQRRSGAELPALAGIPISIKDLFDEAGVVTLGGSKVLIGTPAAKRDSTVVERLRQAGAVIVGRTNMTEFAYSGLGINPHYGTPGTSLIAPAARIPGGSSSGAAISVTDGMAAGAIGTDTGGSVRIPAALNGLVGFKPTARRVPLDGVLPLSLLARFGGAHREDRGRLRLARSGTRRREPDRCRQCVCAACVSPCRRQFSKMTCHPPSPTLSPQRSARLSAAGASIIELPMTEFAQALH